ncbi:hypothetical protein BKI52_42260 [marine bacterium AO1-C]|nr:hypothetical protein BKI52_42260 [marine bacterium AO1-C]
MNRLSATIAQIQHQEYLSLVGLQVDQAFLQVLLTDTPQSTDYLTVGNTIDVLLKETAIVLSKRTLHQEISITNQIPCTITQIEEGEILSKIKVSFGKQHLQIILTTAAYQQMQLQVGESVVALIKANEIMCNP